MVPFFVGEIACVYISSVDIFILFALGDYENEREEVADVFLQQEKS